MDSQNIAAGLLAQQAFQTVEADMHAPALPGSTADLHVSGILDRIAGAVRRCLTAPVFRMLSAEQSFGSFRALSPACYTCRPSSTAQRPLKHSTGESAAALELTHASLVQCLTSN